MSSWKIFVASHVVRALMADQAGWYSQSRKAPSHWIFKCGVLNIKNPPGRHHMLDKLGMAANGRSKAKQVCPLPCQPARHKLCMAANDKSLLVTPELVCGSSRWATAGVA